MNEEFVELIHRAVERIPRGRVLSYGQVAAVIGSRAPRAAARVLAQYGDALPWWRVTRADGTLPLALHARAREHYREEGTALHAANPLRVATRAFLDPAERAALGEIIPPVESAPPSD